MKHSDRYKQDYATLSAAAAGVVMTRTCEPHRVLQALQRFAFEKGLDFKHWNIRDGWTTPPTTRSDKPVVEKLQEPYSALKRIEDVDGNGTNAWDNGVYAMVWPHFAIGSHPPMEDCLRQYARDFPESKRRLVLITPEGFTMPPHLQREIPVLDFDLPSREELRTAYDMLVKQQLGDDVDPPFNDEEVEELLSLGSGMTESEFELACAKAIAISKSEKTWPAPEFKTFAPVISESKTEVVKRSEVLELMQPMSPDDIGGLDLLKDWVRRRKNAFGKEAADFGVDRPKGIALIGPPGTGKSVSAKATASVLGLPLIRFDVGRVFGSLVGQTESRVRSALKQLEAMAPCVAFIDEVDKAGLDPRQSGGDSGVSKRVMGSILTFMQESAAPVFWLFTANRPDALPPELLRKGRMDEVFAVLPPNEVERDEIISIHLAKRKQKRLTQKGKDILIAASRGYVGSELEAAIKESVVDAFETGSKVTAKAIADQLKNMKPISVAFANDFNRMAEWAENNARAASTQTDEELPTAPSTRIISRKARVMD